MHALLAAGATAVVMSERARNVARRGLVYGVAGAIAAGEAALTAGRGVAHGAEQVASSAGDLAGDLIGEAQQARQSGSADAGDTAAGQTAQKRKPAAARR